VPVKVRSYPYVLLKTNMPAKGIFLFVIRLVFHIPKELLSSFLFLSSLSLFSLSLSLFFSLFLSTCCLEKDGGIQRRRTTRRYPAIPKPQQDGDAPIQVGLAQDSVGRDSSDADVGASVTKKRKRNHKGSKVAKPHSAPTVLFTEVLVIRLVWNVNSQTTTWNLR